jgi:hypothetical protein
VQIMACVESGASARLQCSQVGLSSSMAGSRLVGAFFRKAVA